MGEVTIKTIFMLNEDCYKDVKYNGTYNSFTHMLKESKFVRIYEGNKEIYLNTDCIMSFELGND